VIVLLMGVSGSGKTTVGRLLADRLGWEFVDADAHHPASNVAKMASGLALSDEDRAPWLVLLVYLEGRAEVIRPRMEQRTHFMPPGALDGQFATLEAPGADEAPLVLDVALPAEALVEAIVAHLDGRLDVGGRG
jgi:gluconate kinase